MDAEPILPQPTSESASQFDAFISYSSKDKALADATCAALEHKGIRCWIAPRDVRPGAVWAAEIVEAIDACRVLVLVWTSHSNDSNEVLREVQRALSRGVTVIPMRAEEFDPSKALSYFLSNRHWIDAMTPPLERHLGKLAETVCKLIPERAEPVLPGAQAVTVQMLGADAPSKPATAKPPRRRFKYLSAIISAVVICGIVAVGLREYMKGRSNEPTPLQVVTAADEIKRFDGRWGVVSHDFLEFGGRKPPQDLQNLCDEMVLSIKDGFVKRSPSVDAFSESRIWIDPGKNPKEIDIIDENPTGDHAPSKQKVLRAIYKFEGEKIVVAFSSLGKPRPSEFQAIAPIEDDKEQIGICVLYFKKLDDSDVALRVTRWGKAVVDEMAFKAIRQIRKIENAFNAYLLRYAFIPPKKLTDLIRPKSGMFTFLENESDLIDPWGKHFQFQMTVGEGGILVPYVFTVHPKTGMTIDRDWKP